MYFAKLSAVLILITLYENKNITTDKSVTNTRSIQRTHMVQGCSIKREHHN